jgi:hypothetical protein
MTNQRLGEGRARVRFIGEIDLDNVPDPGTQRGVEQIAQDKLGHTGVTVVHVEDWDRIDD